MRFHPLKSCVLFTALAACDSGASGVAADGDALSALPPEVLAASRARPVPVPSLRRAAVQPLPPIHGRPGGGDEEPLEPEPPVEEPEPPVEEPEPPVEEPEPPATADFCPPYTESPLFRRRDQQVVVGPGDDWIGAIERARPGTEVLLRDGQYRLGNHRRIQIGRDVTVRGQSGDRERVVLRGQGYGPEAEMFYITGANVTIADLSAGHVRSFAISIKGELGATAPHIYNVHLTDTGKQHIKLSPGDSRNGVVACSSIGYSPGAVRGDYIDAIDLHRAIDWVIRDNYIYNITGEHNGCNVDRDCGSFVSGPAILIWNHSRGTVIERNIIVDSYRGIALGLGNHHEGGIVRNNFIYRAEGGDSGIELRQANGTLVAHNTIVIGGHRGPIEVMHGARHRIYNNLLSAPIRNRGNASFEEGGNITDGGTRDLVTPREPYLREDSRAVGAGVPVAEVTEDFEGEPRGRRPDVGADQVAPAR